MSRKKLGLWLAAALIVASIGLGAAYLFGSAPAVAQTTPEMWLSSAQPPEGSKADALSAPDSPGARTNLADEAALVPEAPTAIRSMRITGSALKPRDSAVDFDVNVSGGCVYAINNAFDVFNTPVWLPQGSTINTLRMYYNDTSGSNSTAWLTAYDLYGQIYQEWSISSSGNFGNSFNDSAVIDHVIDYSLYSYLLNWRPVVTGTQMQLCGFRIFYEPPPFGAQFLPSVIKD
jgi:hypothetical protein